MVIVPVAGLVVVITVVFIARLFSVSSKMETRTTLLFWRREGNWRDNTTRRRQSAITGRWQAIARDAVSHASPHGRQGAATVGRDVPVSERLKSHRARELPINVAPRARDKQPADPWAICPLPPGSNIPCRDDDRPTPGLWDAPSAPGPPPHDSGTRP